MAPFEEALASESEKIAINRAAVRTSLKSNPDLVRWHGAVRFREDFQDFKLRHLTSTSFLASFGVISSFKAYCDR